jgi:hypothetical protein
MDNCYHKRGRKSRAMQCNISEGDAKDMLFNILQNAPSVQQHISVFNIEGGKGSASLDTSACSSSDEQGSSDPLRSLQF